MSKINYLLCIVALVTLSLSSVILCGQNSISILEHKISPHWYYFGDDEVSILTNKDFIPVFKSEFGLGDNDELTIKDVIFLDKIRWKNQLVGCDVRSINNIIMATK